MHIFFFLGNFPLTLGTIAMLGQRVLFLLLDAVLDRIPQFVPPERDCRVFFTNRVGGFLFSSLSVLVFVYSALYIFVLWFFVFFYYTLETFCCGTWLLLLQTLSFFKFHPWGIFFSSARG
ncbi:BTE_collapsed_G0004110.mRNA.1.CDS.1 [Saccharomyces cerevisiae]|nr:BTE_collapsed_G0004110.mRNA.1.CDS.1 [Saccharomyces cerevisiae]